MKRPVIVSDRSLPAVPLVILVAIVVLLTGYGMYELGLRQAGFKRSEVSSQMAEWRAENKTLKRRNKQLSEQLAMLETASTIDRTAYSQIESELAELQARISEQQEDIEFYAGIVNEGGEPGVRVQEFRVLPGRSDQEYELQIVLAQAFRSERQVSGSLQLQLQGMRRSKAAELTLADVRPPESPPLRYAFRYFQDLRLSVALPPEFSPEGVRLRLQPDNAAAETVDEFFVWRLDQS